MVNIPMQSLDFIDRNHESELLVYLRENIFHVTTMKAYESIQRDRFIFGNQEGKYPIYTGSQKSFGRYQGWICLFDLRGRNDKEIEEALECYYFLGPRWFMEYSLDYTELKLVYLLLSPQCYEHLKPNEIARTSWNDGSGYTQYIPKVECWFP